MLKWVYLEHRMQLDLAISYLLVGAKEHYRSPPGPQAVQPTGTTIIPIEEKLWRQCSEENVEDESHFLCECHKHDERRSNVLKTVYAEFDQQNEP